MERTPPSAVIFDLDGTLADTFPLITSSWNAAVALFTHQVYSEADVIDRFGPTEVEMIRRELPAAQQHQAIQIFLHRYRDDHDRLVRVFAGVPLLLSRLLELKIPLGIMTGKGRDTAEITLSKLGWSPFFSSVITGDEVTRIKPDPQGVLLVAKQLGIEPRHCAFVGDAPADIGAGKAAGMRTVWAGWHPVYANEVRQLHPDDSMLAPSDVFALFNSSRQG